MSSLRSCKHKRALRSWSITASLRATCWLFWYLWWWWYGLKELPKWFCLRRPSELIINVTTCRNRSIFQYLSWPRSTCLGSSINWSRSTCLVSETLSDWVEQMRCKIDTYELWATGLKFHRSSSCLVAFGPHLETNVFWNACFKVKLYRIRGQIDLVTLIWFFRAGAVRVPLK